MRAQADLSKQSKAPRGGGWGLLNPLEGASKTAFFAALIFSAFANLLQLTAPLYMMQIYDRVLGSGSEATLIALSLILCLLFLIMGILEHCRNRLFARIGFRLKAKHEAPIMAQRFEILSLCPEHVGAQNIHRDIDLWAKPWAGPALGALCDLPWSLIFIATLFLFHPALGWFSLIAAAVLLALTIAHQKQSQTALREAHLNMLRADQMAAELKAEAPQLRALGMTGHALQQWQDRHHFAEMEALKLSDQAGFSNGLIKGLRLFLQSAILGLGALLVLRAELSAGAMIAASILLGRSLAPIEIIIGQWEVLIKSRQARGRLESFLKAHPSRRPPLPLPRPQAKLCVENLSLLPLQGEELVLNGIDFRLNAGQALAVIGPSASGKSALARALAGLWPPRRGAIRLGGAALDHYPPETLGTYIGYLPQEVTLLSGTIAENIARLTPTPKPEDIHKAAHLAGCHEMILQLPQAYDTPVQSLAGQLSGGQKQRIALARALYGDPILLVLDEPNSNLDHEGGLALNRAIRQFKSMGNMVILMAHRPAALAECDQVLMLQEGQMLAFGPRDQVLQKVLHPREGAA